MKFLLCVALTITTLTATGNIAPQAARAEYFWTGKRIAHPILKFTNPSELNDHSLTAKQLKQLNELYWRPQIMDFMSTEVRNGELKALNSAKLKSLLLGRSPAKVLEMLGQPGLICGAVDGWQIRSKDETNWLYFMGFWRTGVCITFLNDKCISAKVAMAQQRREIELQGFKDATDFAIGKSELQLRRQFRINQFRNDPFFSNINEALTSDIGDDVSWTFKMANDKCVSTSESFYFH